MNPENRTKNRRTHALNPCTAVFVFDTAAKILNIWFMTMEKTNRMAMKIKKLVTVATKPTIQ
jgi:hypothetical protein